MKISLQVVILCLVCLGDLAIAVRLDLKGRRSSLDHPTIRRRGNLSGNSTLDNYRDLTYFTNITLGGVPFRVMIDTGSADLWVGGGVPNSNATGFKGELKYDVGFAEGPIRTSTLEFAGYTVPDQAYMHALRYDDIDPTLGLGPSSGSDIYKSNHTTATATVLDRIFLQNISTSNFLTVLLGRSDDPTDLFPGDLTVSEILPGYEDVTNQPKLPVINNASSDTRHFQTLLDADGLIGPDGKAIPVQTKVKSTSNIQQATVMFDTGYTFSQLPKSAADAIYAHIPGAEYQNISSRAGVKWIVPCQQEVNITFKFGGKSYPVHPLDATIHPTILGLDSIKNSEGQSSCIGGFQPYAKEGSVKTFDVILGMSFLRNVYPLMNFGDFVAGTLDQREDPYVQLLTTTDLSEAHSDFVKVRLNGTDVPSLGGDKIQGAAKSSPTSVRSRNRTIYYIVTAIACLVVVVLVGLVIFWVIRSRKTAVARGKYLPVQNPTPPSDTKALIH